MAKFDYLEDDLRSCKLCEWRCGVDRLSELRNQKDNLNDLKLGVCQSTIPLVASSQLHPAPPSSFDAFLTGCNFRCVFCQNWPISMFDPKTPGSVFDIEGYYAPETWAELSLVQLSTPEARAIRADRLFFTGGEPTCALPWVEGVVHAARQLVPDVMVNFDTNGFLTKETLNRVLEFTNSITYDLKAYDPSIFSALTGANVKPVLRNLKYIIRNAPDKLWEIRVMVIPGVHDEDIAGISKFLADLSTEVKLNFLAFRPNFAMEDHYGPDVDYLDNCVHTAKEYGLEDVTWSGRPGMGQRTIKDVKKKYKKSDFSQPTAVALPMAYARQAGCDSERTIRNCGICRSLQVCGLRSYKAKKY